MSSSITFLSIFFFFFFDTGFLTEPETHQLARLADQQVSGLLLSALSGAEMQVLTAVLGFYVVRASELRSLR